MSLTKVAEVEANAFATIKNNECEPVSIIAYFFAVWIDAKTGMTPGEKPSADGLVLGPGKSITQPLSASMRVSAGD